MSLLSAGLSEGYPKTAIDFEGNTTSPAASNWSGPTGDTGNFSAQQSTVLKGSYTGLHSVSAGQINPAVQYTRDTAFTPNEMRSRLEFDTTLTGDDTDAVAIEVYDGADTLAWIIEFHDDGNVDLSNQTLGSWSPNTHYKLSMRPDFSDETVKVDLLKADTNELIIDGDNHPTAGFSNSVSDMKYFELTASTDTSDDAVDAYWDQIAFAPNT